MAAATYLWSTATAIVNATLRRLWVAGGGGVFGCLNGSDNKLTPVRTIVDMQTLGNLLVEDNSERATPLPKAVQRSMADFFVRELAAGGGACRTKVDMEEGRH